MIRGTEYGNCNCAWGCPCQFNAPSTHGFCEALVAGHIEEGHFDDTSLADLDWVLLLQWPGEIGGGNGRGLVASRSSFCSRRPGHSVHGAAASRASE